MYAAMSMRRTAVPGGMDPARAVLANCLPHEPGSYATVVADERAGGRAAVDVLIEAGHRDIALLGGGAGDIAASERVRGFDDGMRAAGIAARRDWLLHAGWEIDEGYAAALRVLDAPARPTGLVCANDRVAAGALLAAARLGIDVPARLSVVGYDDQDKMADRLVPALTTVALPHHEMGAAAVRTLLDAADAGQDVDRASELVLKCPVIRRDSVRPPSSP